LTFITIVANSAETTLLLKADTTGTDNQVDASTNNHTITENGNVTSTAFTPYHPGGYSTYFDGSGDYLDISSSNNFIFGTGAFTVECWFYSTDLNHKGGTQYPHIICINSYTNGIYLRPHYNGTSYNVYVGGTSYTFSTTIEENVWTHVALVRDGSGNLILFENGIQIGSTVTGVNYNISTNSSNNRIGAAIHTSGEEFKGYIKDVRVTNTAVYTTNFTSPTETLTAIANTQLLTCHASYIADGSSNSNAITIAGNTSTKRFGPYDYLGYTKAEFGGGVYFDGVDDRLTVASNSDFNIGSDFTFECWCYPTSSSNSGASGNALLMLVWNGSNNSVWLSYTSATKFEFRISYVGGWAHTLTSTDAFALNQWYHVAATRNSGTTYLFINGVQQATGSNNTDVSSTGNTVSIGSQGTGRYFQGYIKDARIVNGTAVYTSAFTPPTVPLTAVTNTKLLTCTNKNDIWEQADGSLLTKVGNTTASNTQRQFTSSSAIYFDGTGDYLTAPASSAFAFGTGDFTIECWVYFDSYETTNGFFVGQNFFSSVFQFNSSGQLQFYSQPASAYVVTGSTALPTNQWVHVAVTRSGNTFKVFLNGIVDGTGTNSSDAGFNSANLLTIGAWNNLAASWIGYMQDVRLTKGLARYTANFTPPTAEFDG
jgi:hypothetical protein